MRCKRGAGTRLLRCRAALPHFKTPRPSIPLQTGMFVDPGAAASEVLGELELQQSRMAQLAAQAGELVGVARELAGADAALLAAAGGGKVAPEVQEAEATLQVRWGLAGTWEHGMGRKEQAGWERMCLLLHLSAALAWPPPHASPAVLLLLCSAARSSGAW